MQKTILTLIASAALVLPLTAGNADSVDVQVQNAAWFEDQVGDAWDDDLVGEVWTADGVEEVTLAEARDLFVDRAGAVSVPALFDEAPRTQGTGDFPLIGDVWLIESATTAEDVSCSQGGGGNGGHYDEAVPSGVMYPLAGYATSDISTFGIGTGIELTPPLGDAVLYSEEVVYGGESDFWCTQFSLFGLNFVTNFPFILGAAQGLEP